MSSFKVVAYTQNDMRMIGIIEAEDEKSAEKIAKDRLKNIIKKNSITSYKFYIWKQ